MELARLELSDFQAAARLSPPPSNSTSTEPATQRVVLLVLGTREVRADEATDQVSALRQLLLRAVASLQSPASPTAAAAEPAEPRHLLTMGRLVLDADAHRAWVEGEEAKLTSLEFRLLRRLCERHDYVHSRAALLREVWGSRGHENTRTVDTHVTRLRSKLKRAGRYIETVRGAGYRFQIEATG
jgi:two-component system phosphate regulon response regulator PhoB